MVAALQQMTTDLRSGFRLGDREVQPRRGRISGPDGSVRVEPKVMEVLMCLAEHAGHVVERETLMNRVWGRTIVTEESLTKAISQIRAYLGDRQRPPRYLETMPKIGYRLIMPVEPLSPQAQPTTAIRSMETVSVVAPADTVVPRRHRPTLIHQLLLGLVAGLVAAGIVILAFQPLEFGDPSHAQPEWSPTPNSIAVLPFVDLSPNGGSEYFGEGLSEDLLNALARVHGLHVAARTSAFSFENEDDIRSIAQQLNVSAVLAGSVRRDGDRVRIFAQLIDARDGYPLWSDNYDRSLEDIFAVEDEISHAIVDALKLELLGPADAMLVQVPTRNMDAYNLYLLGRHFWNKRRPDDLEKAIDYFKQAIRLDPGYSLAYSGLADAHLLLVQYDNRPIAEVETAAQAAIEQALALEPELAEPHASLGLLKYFQGDYDAAASAQQRALDLSPGYVSAQMWYGRALFAMDRYEEALSVYQQALELDPLSPFLNLNVGLSLQYTGRTAAALPYFEKSLELDPDQPNASWSIAYTNVALGRLDEAVKWYLRAVDLGIKQANAIAQLGMTYANLGDYEQAARWLRRAEELDAGASWVIANTIAVNQMRGRYAENVEYARDWLRRDPENPYALVRLALWELMVGDLDHALHLYERVRGESAHASSALFSPWDIEWGDCQALYLANLYLRNGEPAKAEALLAQSEALLASLQEQGYEWWGIHYAKASIHALRREILPALDQLKAARDRGWRDYNWAKADPNMAALRSNTRFNELLAEIETDVNTMRARVAAPTQANHYSGRLRPISSKLDRLNKRGAALHKAAPSY